MNNINKRFTFLMRIALVGFLIYFTPAVSQNKISDDNLESMLCMGHYWTEAEGKAFLDQRKQAYTTKKAWETHAEQIKNQILKGTGFEKYPKKHPLNAIIGEKRVFDGYQVQNVAFESLPLQQIFFCASGR